jgi:hypothetical protein
LYTELSIISGISDAIWSKTNFGPTRHHLPFARMHCCYCFCHYVLASWKLCSVRVFSTACDSATITSVVSKWLKWGNRKNRVGGGNSHVVFGQEFLGEKGNVRRCVIMLQQPVLLSPMVSCSHAEKSQKCAELTVCLARTNPL